MDPKNFYAVDMMCTHSFNTAMENFTLMADNFHLRDKFFYQDPQNYLGFIGSAVIILEIIVGSLGNMLVILAVLTTKTLRKSFNAFIVTLAVTDILFTTVVMPFYVESFIHRRWKLGEFLCKFNTYFGVVLEFASVLQISAIAFYRYMLIVHPQMYRHFSHARTIVLLAIAIFVFSLVVILPNLLDLDGQIAYTDQLGRCNYIREHSKGTLYWLFCASYIPSGILMLFCYLRIINALKESKARVNIKVKFSQSQNTKRRLSETLFEIPKQGTLPVCPQTKEHLPVPSFNKTVEGSPITSSTNISENCVQILLPATENFTLPLPDTGDEPFRQRAMSWPLHQPKNLTKTWRTPNNIKITQHNVNQRTVSAHNHAHSFKMILVIFIAFIVTYIPYTIVNLADVKGCFPRASYMLSSLFFWMGACVNPWIYGAMNSNFLNAYKNIFHRICAKQKTVTWL